MNDKFYSWIFQMHFTFTRNFLLQPFTVTKLRWTLQKKMYGKVLFSQFRLVYTRLLDAGAYKRHTRREIKPVHATKDIVHIARICPWMQIFTYSTVWLAWKLYALVSLSNVTRWRNFVRQFDGKCLSYVSRKLNWYWILYVDFQICSGRLLYHQTSIAIVGSLLYRCIKRNISVQINIRTSNKIILKNLFFLWLFRFNILSNDLIFVLTLFCKSNNDIITFVKFNHHQKVLYFFKKAHLHYIFKNVASFFIPKKIEVLKWVFFFIF